LTNKQIWIMLNILNYLIIMIFTNLEILDEQKRKN
jgi:hypothetical protein